MMCPVRRISGYKKRLCSAQFAETGYQRRTYVKAFSYERGIAPYGFRYLWPAAVSFCRTNFVTGAVGGHRLVRRIGQRAGRRPRETRPEPDGAQADGPALGRLPSVPTLLCKAVGCPVRRDSPLLATAKIPAILS